MVPARPAGAAGRTNNVRSRAHGARIWTVRDRCRSPHRLQTGHAILSGMHSTAYLDAIRSRLAALRESLLGVADTTDASAATVELDQAKVGRLSRMDALQGQAMAQASVARREQTLRRIDAALRRIDDGEYGYCADCGDAIAAPRLDADPTATLCIGCASARERER